MSKKLQSNKWKLNQKRSQKKLSLLKKMLNKLMKLKTRKRQAKQLQESNARTERKLKKSQLLKGRKSLQKVLQRQSQTSAYQAPGCQKCFSVIFFHSGRTAWGPWAQATPEIKTNLKSEFGNQQVA